MCDKCGTTLSDDSSAHCYSAEPKRPCLETRASDTASSQCNGITTSNAAVSTSSALSTASDNSVRPQALYVNVNNQAFPVLGVAATTASASTVSRSSVAGSSNMNSSTLSTNAAAVSTTNQASAPAARTILTAQAGTQPRPSNIVPGTMTAISLPTYSLQPPAQPSAPTITRIPIPGIVSASLQTPVQSTTSATAPSSYVFQVSAVQIRLGAKKFKPLTAVTFKDDGVLFTLTGMLID